MNKAQQPKQKLNRRQFLGLAWTGSMTLFFGQMAVAFINYLKPVSSGGFGGSVYAGRVEEFAVNSVNRILAGRFFIVRTEAGLLALWQKCTHLGCAVPWIEEEGQFHCPCHGSIFNRHGEVTGGPAPRPLDMFPIELRNGEIWVDTSKPTERGQFEPSQIKDI